MTIAIEWAFYVGGSQTLPIGRQRIGLGIPPERPSDDMVRALTQEFVGKEGLDISADHAVEHLRRLYTGYDPAASERHLREPWRYAPPLQP